jgi:hypothetical protein
MSIFCSIKDFRHIATVNQKFIRNLLPMSAPCEHSAKLINMSRANELINMARSIE